MRALRLRKEARDEIEDAFEWYRGQSPLAALRFLVAVDEALARIREQPETFPLATGTLRRTLLRRFPYAVYFKVYDRTISVVGVVHGHRHPRAWRRREP
jgi:plasmid stabilization system protein ParE